MLSFLYRVPASAAECTRAQSTEQKIHIVQQWGVLANGSCNLKGVAITRRRVLSSSRRCSHQTALALTLATHYPSLQLRRVLLAESASVPVWLATTALATCLRQDKQTDSRQINIRMQQGRDDLGRIRVSIGAERCQGKCHCQPNDKGSVLGCSLGHLALDGKRNRTRCVPPTGS